MHAAFSGSGSRRPGWLRAAVPALAIAATLAMAGPAFASGGGGGGGGGTVTPTLKSITFTPSPVIGGGGETATVTFTSAPSQGAVVQVSSSNAAAGFSSLTNGSDVILPPGQASGQIALITSAVTAPVAVTITATAFGTTTISGVLTVNPGAPPAADTVRVTQFQWQRGIQTIQATSSNSNAVLNVFDADGTWTGITLTSQGGGRYSSTREEVFPPDQPIIVESNFGGSGTATAQISN